MSTINDGLLEQIEYIGNGFAAYRVIVFENDSTDGTPDLLRSWAARNSRVEVRTEILGNAAAIQYKERISILAGYRNLVLARSLSEVYDNSDLIIWLDMDWLPVPPPLDVLKANLFESWDAICAVKEMRGRERWIVPQQHDNLALRDETWTFKPHKPSQSSQRIDHTTRQLTNTTLNTILNDHPWVQQHMLHRVHFQRRIREKAVDEGWILQPASGTKRKKRDVVFSPNKSLLVPVNSCMNGLIMYKRHILDGCVFDGLTDCEWISLHDCIREKHGKLYLNAAWRIEVEPTVSDPDIYNIHSKHTLPFDATDGFFSALTLGYAVGQPPPGSEIPKLGLNWAREGDGWISVHQLLNLSQSALSARGLNSEQATYLAARIRDLSFVVQLSRWKS